MVYIVYFRFSDIENRFFDMNDISIERSLMNLCPDLRLGCLQCAVQVEPSSGILLQQIRQATSEIAAKLRVEDISQAETIKAAKEAYRQLGKDPSRYRPSAEALSRRVVSGKGLYQINNVVDCLNLVSVTTGFSIGGYDADKINGEISLGIGREDEPYEAIGRGALNIHQIPLFRDQTGAFGSPTSDSIRTMVTDDTTTFLMIILDFGHADKLTTALEFGQELLGKYALASRFELKII